MPSETPGSPSSRAPLHPAAVMAAALFPGAGQLLNLQPTRATIFVFFMLLLGWVSFQFTTAEHSFVGRHAGGFFIYAISVMDAYRWACYRRELFRSRDRQSPATAGPAPH